MANPNYDTRKPSKGLELRGKPPALPSEEKTALQWPALPGPERKVWKDKEEKQ